MKRPRLTFPLCSVKIPTLGLTCTIPTRASGIFSLPILLIYCNDRRMMGIQTKQFCNMNMKFAALLLFVGATRATWCLNPDGSDCPGETAQGQATTACCDQVKGLQGQDSDRGCWVVDEKKREFFSCCHKLPWACTSIENRSVQRK